MSNDHEKDEIESLREIFSVATNLRRTWGLDASHKFENEIGMEPVPARKVQSLAIIKFGKKIYE
jgi:hypothetical protein